MQFHYQRPAPLVDPGKRQLVWPAAINDFLRGFADIVWLGEFGFTSALSSFWLGLTNSILPIPVLHLTLRQNCRRCSESLVLRSGNQLG